MGKQGSPRSPRPHFRANDFSFVAKEYQIRSSETLPGNDPSFGRRISGSDSNWNSRVLLVRGSKSDSCKFCSCKGVDAGKEHSWLPRNLRLIAFMFSLMGFLFLPDTFMASIFDSVILHNSSGLNNSTWPERNEDWETGKETAQVQMYGRLLNLASNALAEKEFKQEKSKFWEETYPKPSLWKPCADRKSFNADTGMLKDGNGYIIVSANGGLNQQRVAICNSVAVASLLNATLVLPRFLYSNVWKDPSQFGDIYQEDYFVEYLKDEVNIIKDLPPHLKSLDIEESGILVTDAELVKEAKPSDYIEKILPLLKRNGVVHLFGYGNRLGFDPLPPNIQRLRCKCNFHALKFVPKIQKMGSLLVKRIRSYSASESKLDKELLGEFMTINPSNESAVSKGPSKYLALHLRFEEDMVAYSLCDFGGGEKERRELQAYREEHFPLLLQRLKKSKPISPQQLRKLGKCPLTPEEVALVLAGLGFKHRIHIYLAGSEIYGGKSRMNPLTRLYPNSVTKEMLLTPDELEPFKNFSSQLAALDFIACATSDVFAMTDSGSQLSSLVSGFRTYYGNGRAPTLRPNKKRLATILSESKTIDWKAFEERVRKMTEEGQRVGVRGFGKSIYRQPRCPQCMCKSH